MTGVLEVIGTGLIVLGTLAFVATAVGIVRLPDLYSRISSVTTASGFGVGLVVFGVVLHAPSVTNVLQGILAVLLNLTTAAVGGHALGRAGYLTGAPLSRRTGYDDLEADSGVEGDP